MFYIADRKTLSSKVQAPFVLAEIKALRSSIFKNTMEVQQALTVAAVVEQKYDLTRADLFLPVLDTFCAILDPLSGTLLRGTLRRVGNEIFPALISVLGIPSANVKVAMGLKEPPDLIRAICGYYSQCVIGPEAGSLAPMVTHRRRQRDRHVHDALPAADGRVRRRGHDDRHVPGQLAGREALPGQGRPRPASTSSRSRTEVPSIDADRCMIGA